MADFRTVAAATTSAASCAVAVSSRPFASVNIALSLDAAVAASIFVILSALASIPALGLISIILISLIGLLPVLSQPIRLKRVRRII